MNLHEHLHELTTVALLGTDRREPPAFADVPADLQHPLRMLADVVADAQRTTPSQRLLVQVAALSVAQRTGVVPLPPVPLAEPAPGDDRPITPAAATSTWRRVVADWAVLEDEWLLTVVAAGRRLAPELVPPVLARHRGDRTRHQRALLAAGPLGHWMIDWSPRLGRPAGDVGRAAPSDVGSLPELPLMPEVAVLLTAPAARVADVFLRSLSVGAWGPGHRAVLVNFVARVDREVLPALIAALDQVDPSSPSIGLAFALADLARLRHHMLTELEPA